MKHTYIKYTIANIITLLLLILAGTSSCTCKREYKPDHEKVAAILEKHEQYGKIDERDYDELLSYVEHATYESLPLLEDLNNAKYNEKTKVKNVISKFDNITTEYPHYEQARDLLMNASESDVNSKTYRRIIELRDKIHAVASHYMLIINLYKLQNNIIFKL